MDKKYRIIAIWIVVILFGSEVQSGCIRGLKSLVKRRGIKVDELELCTMPPRKRRRRPRKPQKLLTNVTLPTGNLTSKELDAVIEEPLVEVVDNFDERLKNGKLQCTNEDFSRLIDANANSSEKLLSFKNNEQNNSIFKDYIENCSKEVSRKIDQYESPKLDNLGEIYKEMSILQKYFKMDDSDECPTNSKKFLWTPANASFSEWITFINELAVKQGGRVIFELEEQKQSQETINRVIESVLDQTCRKISEEVPLGELFGFGLKLAKQVEIEKRKTQGTEEFCPNYMFDERLINYHICDQLRWVFKFEWVKLIQSAKLRRYLQ